MGGGNSREVNQHLYFIGTVPASNWLNVTTNAMEAKSKGAIFILNLKHNDIETKQISFEPGS